MTLVTALLAFIAGIACGLALRPGLDRRRKLRRAFRAARVKRVSQEQLQPQIEGEFVMPRDYYLAGRKERGSLAEGFGLKSAAGGAAGAGKQADPDPSRIPTPRDYYERETPEDEGLLSEGFGLKRQGEGQA